MRERGGEDFGDLDDMPTLEQERAEDERRFANVGEATEDDFGRGGRRRRKNRAGRPSRATRRERRSGVRGGTDTRCARNLHHASDKIADDDV